jgi:hypothetical protein
VLGLTAGVLSGDGFQDDGTAAGELGYLYKLHIPVHKNRSIETYGRLLDAKNNELHRFRVRAHGLRDDGVERPWPDYSDDVGLTEFGDDGATVTGERRWRGFCFYLS